MAERPLSTVIALTLLATAAQAQEAAAPAPTTPAAEAPAAEAPAAEAPTADTIEKLLARFSDDPDRFTQTDGEALYRTTCQACHMADGEGAEGAGAHPPLAGNPKMRSKHFLAGVILTGYHGMPRFANQMSDDQVAAVTNYVRSHFGNDYADPITPTEVADLRPPEDND